MNNRVQNAFNNSITVDDDRFIGMKVILVTFGNGFKEIDAQKMKSEYY